MKRILLSVLAVLPAFLLGQYSPKELDLMKQYGESIKGEDIHAHLSFLADDLLEGRETGERGQKLAAAYIRANFMKLGLQPGNPQEDSYFQQYFLRRTTVNSAEITLNDTTFAYSKDFFALKGLIPDEVTGDWDFVGYGIQTDEYDNLKGMDLEEKIVFLIADKPSEGGAMNVNLGEQLDNWTQRAANLHKLGAAHVFMELPKQAFTTLQLYSKFSPQDVTSSEEIPYGLICVSEGMGEYLLKAVSKKPEKVLEKLQKADKVPAVDFSKLSWTYAADIEREFLPAENVMGYMEGTDKKDELLVLTAHYDHIGIVKDQINNGADDDGSGTSAILEIAEAFSKAAENGNRPRRSILFMTVSGEEKGLLGSQFYTENPIYPLEQTIVNLNIDMIGRIDKKYQSRADSTNYVYLIGSDKLSSDLHKISEATNQALDQITLDYTYNDENDPNRFYYRSDHYNFAKNRIPVIFYFTGVHVDYHKPTDDVYKIQFDKTAKITQLVFGTAWELANREERIKVDSNKK
ncbi:MAG: M28 family peptidase [Bacteroidota bacterium]